MGLQRVRIAGPQALRLLRPFPLFEIFQWENHVRFQQVPPPGPDFRLNAVAL